MEHIKRHIFVCINQRPPNHPMGCCQSKGSIELAQVLTEAIETNGLGGHTALAEHPGGSLGPAGMLPETWADGKG